jgi:peptidoglycan/LPS O-acetylase OafA/YrhL
MKSKVQAVSWVLLVVFGALTLLGGLASAWNAYSSGPDQIGPVSLEELAGGREEVAVALRGRRGTAAAFAAAFGLLFLTVALVPYRRGDVWAWWALAAATLLSAALILARLPALGLELGASVGWAQLVWCGVAFLLGAGRLRAA